MKVISFDFVSAFIMPKEDSDNIIVDFKYFISLVLNDKITWEAISFILNDLTPTLEKSKLVVEGLLQELRKLQSELKEVKKAKKETTEAEFDETLNGNQISDLSESESSLQENDFVADLEEALPENDFATDAELQQEAEEIKRERLQSELKEVSKAEKDSSEAEFDETFNDQISGLSEFESNLQKMSLQQIWKNFLLKIILLKMKISKVRRIKFQKVKSLNTLFPY